MYSYGPPHMAKQKQDDQLELTYSSYVKTLDVTLKTCQRRWIIRRSGERGLAISVLAAWHDDYLYIYIYIYIYMPGNAWKLFNARRIYIYIYIRRALKSFQAFLVQAFKIVVDSWKSSMLLLNILWHDWIIFKISLSNEQLQQQLEYTLLTPDCHSWGISKMQSDTLKERYAIKFYFKLEKNATET